MTIQPDEIQDLFQTHNTATKFRLFLLVNLWLITLRVMPLFQKRGIALGWMTVDTVILSTL